MHLFFKSESWVDIRIQCHTKSVLKGKGVSQLLRAYNEAKMPPFVALEHGVL
jgi:hypothetical protein